MELKKTYCRNKKYSFHTPSYIADNQDTALLTGGIMKWCAKTTSTVAPDFTVGKNTTLAVWGLWPNLVRPRPTGFSSRLSSAWGTSPTVAPWTLTAQAATAPASWPNCPPP